MRKITISSPAKDMSTSSQNWLDLERLAQVEITSEDAAHPVELALTPGAGGGWRAAEPGEQTIRIIFDHPLDLHLIHLRFDEEEQSRTQEFELRCLAEGQDHSRGIVRQQYTFSPPGTIQEIEDYRVELDKVTALELTIVPDISGGRGVASLAQMRLA